MTRFFGFGFMIVLSLGDSANAVPVSTLDGSVCCFVFRAVQKNNTLWCSDNPGARIDDGHIRINLQFFIHRPLQYIKGSDQVI